MLHKVTFKAQPFGKANNIFTKFVEKFLAPINFPIFLKANIDFKKQFEVCRLQSEVWCKLKVSTTMHTLCILTSIVSEKAMWYDKTHPKDADLFELVFGK